MRVTICQLPNDPAALVTALSQLLDHVGRHASELLVLPEMPFAPWPCAQPSYVAEQWQSAMAAHERWMSELLAMAPTSVLLSKPVISDEGQRLNRAIAVEAGQIRAVHDKFYLPNEDGFWEASWYHRGDGSFDVFELAGAKAGVLLCTEMWFSEQGRRYGKAGAELIVVPRATPRASVESWITGGRTLAMVSGCYVLSSNLAAPHADGADLGGVAFACDPDGRVMATTSDSNPFVTLDVDLQLAKDAKASYPRYVREASEAAHL